MAADGTAETGGRPDAARPVASPPVSHIVVSELEYAPPGSDALFFDVSFTVTPGEHAALIGVNGVGKSTILRLLAGELEPDEGSFSMGGTVLRMTQEVGMAHPDQTLREMLIEVAPPALRVAGRALVAAERAMFDGTSDGVEYAERLGDWGDLGGYELEGRWEAAASRSVKTPVDRLRHAQGRRAQRRRAQAARARPAPHQRRRRAAARRAGQLPRRAHPGLARGADHGHARRRS